MAKRASRKKSTKKSSSTKRKASTRKAAPRKVAATSVTAQAPSPMATQGKSCECRNCTTELEEEHRVLSHIMWLLFLLSTAVAAFFTFSLMFQAYNQGYALLALVFLGWAYFFKTLGHRIHVLHH